jgi:hypothetical protein
MFIHNFYFLLIFFVKKEKKIIENVSIIEEEVKNHDVLFLLTDTRESRWLPTLLANKYNKVYRIRFN